VEDTLRRLREAATAASIADLKKEVGAIAAMIPHLATAASVSELKARMSTMETRIIKWMFATGLVSTGLACAIAKLVH
jgi:hypothetical protein